MGRKSSEAIEKDLVSKAEKLARSKLAAGKEFKPRSESGRKALQNILKEGAIAKEKEMEKVSVPKLVEKFEPVKIKQAQLSHIIPLKQATRLEYTVPLQWVHKHHHLAGYVAGPMSVHGHEADLYTVGAEASNLEPVESKEAKFIKNSNKMFMDEQKPKPRFNMRVRHHRHKNLILIHIKWGNHIKEDWNEF